MSNPKYFKGFDTFEEWKEKYLTQHPGAATQLSDKELHILCLKERLNGDDPRDPGHYPDVFRGCNNCESRGTCPDFAMSHSWGCNNYDLSLDKE